MNATGYWVQCPGKIAGVVAADEGRWVYVNWSDGIASWSQAYLLEWL